MVHIAAGETSDREPTPGSGKDPDAVALGRKVGLKGGRPAPNARPLSGAPRALKRPPLKRRKVEA